MAYAFVAASSQRLSTASSPASGSPMTICAWARCGNITAAVTTVGVNAGTNRNQVQVSSNSLQLFAVGSAGQGQANGPSTFTSNVYNHFAGVFESSTSRTAYLNGTAGTANTTNCGSQAAATEVTVGARWSGSLGNYFTGDVAEVGIWNVSLTADEIASLAKGMTCDKVRPQSLVFYAPLVRDLIDYKGGLTITNNNTATVANHPRVYA